MHPLLTYFAYTNNDFNKGKAIYTKTIYHEKSKKNGLNEWIHPDIVGFYIPIDEWNNTLIEFNKVSASNSIKLYSFELKKNRILIHKQIIRKHGKIYMRLKSRDLTKINLT